MAMSGVTLDEAVVGAMADVRMKRTRYVILTIGNDGKQVVVNSVGDREATYEAFVSALTTSGPCYAAFDFQLEDGREKMLLFLWIPDTAPPRAKMLYSASRDALNAVAEGFLPIQANDTAELERAEIARRVAQSKSYR